MTEPDAPDCFVCKRPAKITYDAASHTLAAHVVQSRRTGRSIEIGSDWKEAARVHDSSTISQKLRMLLAWVALQSKVGVSIAHL